MDKQPAGISLAMLAQTSFVPLASMSSSDPRRRRAERFVDELNLTSEKLVEILDFIARNERFEELIVDAMDVAIRGNSEHRSKGLALVVRQAIGADEAAISHLRLIQRAIIGIDSEDLRSLAFIAGGLPRRIPNPSDHTSQLCGGTRLDALEAALPRASGANQAIAARLLSLGVLEDCAIGTIGYRPSWSVTDFGREVLIFLKG
jgi:hypothetical protein